MDSHAVSGLGPRTSNLAEALARRNVQAEVLAGLEHHRARLARLYGPDLAAEIKTAETIEHEVMSRLLGDRQELSPDDEWATDLTADEWDRRDWLTQEALEAVQCGSHPPDSIEEWEDAYERGDRALADMRAKVARMVADEASRIKVGASSTIAAGSASSLRSRGRHEARPPQRRTRRSSRSCSPARGDPDSAGGDDPPGYAVLHNRPSFSGWPA